MRRWITYAYADGMEVTHTESRDEFVTVSEAARIAGVSNDTIRRYADKGVLPVFRTPANHRRFRTADVLNLIKPQQVA